MQEFEDVARALDQSGVYHLGNFVLVSGSAAKGYWDITDLKSQLPQRRVVLDTYLQMLSSLKFDLIADVPTSTTFLTAIISEELHVPMVTPRAPKDHGRSRQVEGVFKEGQIAVILEDIVTTGGSALVAAQRLRDEKLKVADVVALIDAERGARETLATSNLDLHAFTTNARLLKYVGQNSSA